ncbi:MAG TPA: FAD-binding protein [Desulfosporosinus sp.]|nr:FAD-binding protein [Desulfosporosinus sp.]
MWDGIIVGGGLAGLLAGIRASERGKRILIISEGVGSLTYSSGVIDFGDVGGLLGREKHPYTLMGETVVRAGMDYFQTLFPDYQGKWGETQQVLTPLGSPRRAGLVPRGLNAGALQDARQIMLIAPKGMKDFFPEVIKTNLERVYGQGGVQVHPIRLEAFEPWYANGKSVTEINYAKYWRSDAGIAVLKGLLNRLAQEKDTENHGMNVSQGTSLIERVTGSGKMVAVFPGLASGFSNSLKNILSEAPFPVVEMTAFPPTASGQTLYEALIQKFRSFGGELLVGAGVKQVEFQGRLCHKVIVQSKGRDTEFSARSFVLATGGIFGGGIEVTPDSRKETVFGLPLFVPSEWTRPEFLGEQPYARMGIEVDRELRPIEPQSQEVIIENVQVVGRMLAHWDPWVEHCGGGKSETLCLIESSKM